MKRSRLTTTLYALVALAGSQTSTLRAQAPNPNFEFATGNGPIEVIIPTVIPIIFQTVQPGDAPLVLRTTTMLTNSWFDAIAPYHPTAVGVNSRLGRSGATEATDENRNIAIFHASYHVLNSLYPYHANLWREMMENYGLDPDDGTTDPGSPIGLGNLAGAAVVAFREADGMNQRGDEPPFSQPKGKSQGQGKGNTISQADGPLVYPNSRYFDHTGYRPVNTSYALDFPARWQPQAITNEHGIYQIQSFQVPQFSITDPYSYPSPKAFRAPDPIASSPRNHVAYKQQADAVLAASAAMTDKQKMIAELYDDKIRSLGFSALFLFFANAMSLEEFVHYDFLVNMAAYDTGIAIWQEKLKFDAVRPASAIAHLYKEQAVTAWGGYGRGTVSDLPASSWKPYLQVASHSEYPSGSAAFCGAHAQASRRYFNSDVFGWQIPVSAGSSVVEPGITPATDIILSFPTWTDFEQDCGNSRFWAGVHFPASITAGREIGNAIGDLAYGYFTKLVDGTAPLAAHRNIKPEPPSTWK